MSLTDERRSYDDGVLVAGQLGDAVGVLGGAEMEHVPHIFAFVAHGSGAVRVTNGSTFGSARSPWRRSALKRSYSPASRSNEQLPVIHFQAVPKGHRP